MTAEQLVGEEMAKILRGCTTSLIEDLAALQGSTVEDLTVSVQIMPFGNRATLLAYDCVSKEGGRYRALPKLLRLVGAAHDVHDHLTSEGAWSDLQAFLGE